MNDGSGAEDNKRQHRRTHVLIGGTIRQGSASFECIIKDLSASGAQIETDRPIPARGPSFTLDINRAGSFGSELAWRNGNRMGMVFLQKPGNVAKRIGKAWGLSDAPTGSPGKET